MRQVDLREPTNPFDEKAARYANGFEFARDRGDIESADRFWGAWQRMIEKGMEWENAMAVVRNEILDAVYAYEKRIGLR